VTYATEADLALRYRPDRLLELADRDQDGEADAGVIAAALADANYTINGYVVGRYQVPLAPAEELVVRIACDLAWFYLHGDTVPEEVKDRHDQALRTLRDIAAGVVKLQAAGIAAAPAAATDLTPVFAAPPSRMADAVENF
jgi:phage gp36-like protein